MHYSEIIRELQRQGRFREAEAVERECPSPDSHCVGMDPEFELYSRDAREAAIDVLREHGER